MEPVIVQKYGGTSVGSIERIQKVAERVVAAKAEGFRVVVVVSAMGDTTDELLKKARSLNADPGSREMDMLLATGEQISIALLAMAIQKTGHDAISLTGYQCRIITDAEHKNARIHTILPERLNKELAQHGIVIVAGFQGITEDDEITTLGRGGSDITAVALAAALQAEKCEIYTDVQGVYTADPNLVSGARLLDQISYEEMLELAALGAAVLHPRSVEIAKKYGIPVWVRSSFDESEGTKICEVNVMEQITVRGIALDEQVSKIAVLEAPDRPVIPSHIVSGLLANNIHVDMFSQNRNRHHLQDIFFSIRSDELDKALLIARELAGEMGVNKVLPTERMAKVSIVGTGIARSAAIASRFFACFSELEIDIHMLSTSESKISCLIHRDRGVQVLRHIHEKFALHKIHEEVFKDE